jgi:Nucleoside 2-deoxyribosyltransferase like
LISNQSQTEKRNLHLAQVALAESLRQMFGHVDVTGRGTVSYDEFMMFLHYLGFEQSRVDTLLAVVGIEQDSRLDYGSFCQGILRILDNEDAGEFSCDVFLGGACGNSTWRKTIAIPLFRAGDVSFYDPQVENWNQHLVVLENVMKAVCRHLIFVINGTTRSLASMIEAAQYIGEGRRVTLVINPVSVGTEIAGEIVSESEARDLNRARTYLAGVAQMHDIPVFDNVAPACQHMVKQIEKERKEMVARKLRAAARRNKQRRADRRRTPPMLRRLITTGSNVENKHEDSTEHAPGLARVHSSPSPTHSEQARYQDDTHQVSDSEDDISDPINGHDVLTVSPATSDATELSIDDAQTTLGGVSVGIGSGGEKQRSALLSTGRTRPHVRAHSAIVPSVKKNIA